MKKEQGFATRAIHAGQKPDPTTGAVMTPIYATSTYVQESPGKHKGYDYARSINPTRLAYEKCIADLESGTRGFAFASGLAAMATVLEVLDSGSHVVASDDLYGGTFRLFDRVRRRSAKLDFTYVDLTDPEDLERAIKANTRMIWIETPSNPLLKLIDLEAIAKIARASNGAALCKRAGNCALARGTDRDQISAVPRSQIASAARSGPTTDARVRRHGHDRFEDGPRRNATFSREHGIVCVGRKLGRRGKPYQSSRAHDACLCPEGKTRGAGRYRFTRQA